MAKASTKWLSDEEQLFWRSFVRTSSKLLNRLDQELADETGLELADYGILVQLSEAPDVGVRMSDLAEHAVVSRPRLTVRIQRLEQDGLVQRHKCPTDARSTMVTLTTLGRKRLQECAPVHVAGVRRYFIDPVGRDALCSVSQQLRAILCALDDPWARADNAAD
jgi:DNA-binding MarR family transcriptional regulator